ncbi:MAG: glycerophosphoryl diester phosphodiesterase [Alphaproteobacteria bacterium]|nr:glycerophosphoryl diester phosphodiesterase [Alphaproteobacteria bacterium]
MRHPTFATLPPLIGHRGAAACAPENTLAGFRRARALNCRWVEFDVRLTSDRQPILLHDDRLQRTTDGRGKASALSLASIRRHSAGAWFDPSYKEERVPTLEEALRLLAELRLGANIELKAVRGREAETGAVVAERLVQLCPSNLPELLISSFRPVALAAARARAPDIARGILFRAVPTNWRAIAEEAGCATIHVDHQRLYAALADRIRAAGYPLLAYTVNDRERARTLFAWGVSSVFSDDPRRLEGATAPDRLLLPGLAS